MSSKVDTAAKKSQDVELQVEKVAEPILPPFDGRRGWLMATGGSLGLFATFVSLLGLSQCSSADCFLKGFTNGMSAPSGGKALVANLSLLIQVLARIKAIISNALTPTQPPSPSSEVYKSLACTWEVPSAAEQSMCSGQSS